MPIQRCFIQNSFEYLLLIIFQSFSRPRSSEQKKPQLSASPMELNIPPTIYKILTHGRYQYFVRPPYISWRVWVEQISTTATGLGPGLSRARKTSCPVQKMAKVIEKHVIKAVLGIRDISVRIRIRTSDIWIRIGIQLRIWLLSSVTSKFSYKLPAGTLSSV